MVSAAAGARPSVMCVAPHPCPSHSQCNSRSQGNQEWAPQYLVQLFLKTKSSIFSPPPDAAASVQYKFYGEGVSDCSQKYAGRGSSISVFNNPSILSKALRGSGSDKVQGFPARWNQLVRVVHWLSYSRIHVK
jgi:hypothetical protein